MGIIYVARNKVDGKEYVGCTVNLRMRMNKHKSDSLKVHVLAAFHRALREYGWDAFEWSVLFEQASITIAVLHKLEKQFIRERNSRCPYGYNLTDGGEGIGRPAGFKQSEETKAKMRGRVRTKEHRLALSLSLKGRIHPPVTEETRAKLKAAANSRDDQYRKTMSAAKRGQRLGKSYVDEVGEKRAKQWSANLVVAQKEKWQRAPKLICPICGWVGTAGVMGMHKKRLDHYEKNQEDKK